MALFDLTTNLLEQALVGASARQQALANNVANANTPGYRRVDVDFHSALRDALADGRVGNDDPTRFAPMPDGSTPVRADGSTVDTDTEMASLSANALEYQALVSIQRTRIHMIESAIGAR